MNDILTRIKKLEKKAKEADHYKELYENLFNEIQEVIKKLNQFSPQKTRTYTKRASAGKWL